MPEIATACAILPITSVTFERDSAEPPVDYLRQVQREDRLADKVADLLKKAILSGQLRPGDRLPPERILGDRFAVSRTVIREAIRGLAAKGLVEVRSGSGTVVARVGAGSVTETMQLYLQGASIDYDAIHEVRVMLEVHVAGVAAERATESDLHELHEVLRSMVATAHDPDICAVQDAEFHRGLARATHNPLHAVMLDAIGEPIMTVRRATLNLPGRAATAIGGHARILERITAQDAAGARQAMAAHLTDSRGVWERLLTTSRTFPIASGEPTPELQPAE